MKSETFYWWVHDIIMKCPYFIRLIFWRLLYIYNSNKYSDFPNDKFALKAYLGYAKKKYFNINSMKIFTKNIKLLTEAAKSSVGSIKEFEETLKRLKKITKSTKKLGKS